MSDVALIRLAPIFDPVRDLDTAPFRTVFQRGSLSLRGDAPPVLVNHEDDRSIGHVRQLIEHRDADADWIAALASITDAPEWLRRGARASFRLATLQRQMIDNVERVLRGLVSEVSVLSVDVKPAEPLAQVVAFYPERSDLSVAARSDTAGLIVRRPAVGRVLGVR
jgi:hypothetical protein